MANLTDFAKPKLSFKKGTFAFKKKRKVVAKNPAMPMAKKFKIVTSAVEKEQD